jgi:hypothetical protein
MSVAGCDFNLLHLMRAAGAELSTHNYSKIRYIMYTGADTLEKI